MQPLDAKLPIDPGLLVPCIPKVSQGAFRPNQYPPKGPSFKALLVILQLPIGDGVSFFPIATGYFFTNIFVSLSSSESDNSLMSIKII